MERLFPFAAAAVCFAVALIVPASPPEPHSERDRTTTTTIPPAPDAAIAIGTVTIHAAGPGADGLDPAVEGQIVATLRDYLRDGLLLPLAGTSAGDPDSLFTPSARRRLAGPDRAVVLGTNTWVPRGRRWVQLDRADADLSVLVGAAGEVGAVAAVIDWEATSHGPAGDHLRVRRTGELVLVPDGDRWRIDAYELDVEQQLAAPTFMLVPDEEAGR